VKPLAGRRVLVTRPREQAAELSHALRELGADVLLAPLIRIASPADPWPLQRAAADIQTFEWVVLTSGNAADAFARALSAVSGRSSLPASIGVCAVGPATAAQARKHGLAVDLVADEWTAEGVVAALMDTGPMKGRRVLIPRADIAREYVASALRRAGAEVTEVVAYRTVPEERVPDEVQEALAAGLVDVVIFTSGSAVRSFAAIFGADASRMLQRAAVAVIGPTTAGAARQAGIPVAIQPATFAVPALVQAIAAHYRAG
jgi:uroporphyrinogen III methyltransferase/synthase